MGRFSPEKWGPDPPRIPDLKPKIAVRAQNAIFQAPKGQIFGSIDPKSRKNGSIEAKMTVFHYSTELKQNSGPEKAL